MTAGFRSVLPFLGLSTFALPPITDDGIRVRLDSVAVEAYLGGSWTAITSDVLDGSLSIRQGISGTNDTDLIASPSVCSFVLKNNTGKYYTEGGSALTGWGNDVKIRAIFTYDSQPVTEFVGWVRNTQPAVEISANADRVRVTAYDWLEQASRALILSPEIQSNITAAQAVQAVIDACPIAPEAVSLADGPTFITAFDTVREKTAALGELAKIAKSAFTHLYMRRDGTLVLEAPDKRNNEAVSTVPGLATDANTLGFEDGDVFGFEDGNAFGLESYESLGAMTEGYVFPEIKDGANYLNYLRVTCEPRTVSAEPEVLAKTPDPVLVTAGGTKTIRLEYADYSGRGARRVAALTSQMETPNPGGVQDDTLSLLLNFQADATDDTGLNTATLGEGTGGQIVDTFHSDGYGNTDVSGNIIGGWSIYGGGANYYCSIPGHARFDFGGGAYTVDLWACVIDKASGDALFTRSYTTAYPPWVIGVSDGSNLYAKLSFNGSSYGLTLDMGRINASKWQFYRLCGDGTGWHYAYTGTTGKPKLISSGFSASAFPDLGAAGTLMLGLWNTNVYAYCGLDVVRVYKGKCLGDEAIPEIEPGVYLEQDYEGNTDNSFAGTDVTSDITVTPSYGTEAVEVLIENANASDAYVNYQQRGIGIFFYGQQSAEAAYTAGINADGYKSVTIDQKCQHTTDSGLAAITTILATRQNKRTDLLGLSFFANQSSYFMRAALYIDVGGLVQVELDRAGVNGYYYIQERTLEVGAGNLLTCKWRFCQDFTHVY